MTKSSANITSFLFVNLDGSIQSSIQWYIIFRVLLKLFIRSMNFSAITKILFLKLGIIFPIFFCIFWDDHMCNMVNNFFFFFFLIWKQTSVLGINPTSLCFIHFVHCWIIFGRNFWRTLVHIFMRNIGLQLDITVMRILENKLRILHL